MQEILLNSVQFVISDSGSLSFISAQFKVSSSAVLHYMSQLWEETCMTIEKLEVKHTLSIIIIVPVC